MKAQIFDNLAKLNEFLQHRKPTDIISIVYQSQVVNQTMDAVTSQRTFDIVDRILVITR